MLQRILMSNTPKFNTPCVKYPPFFWEHHELICSQFTDFTNKYQKKVKFIEEWIEVLKVIEFSAEDYQSPSFEVRNNDKMYEQKNVSDLQKEEESRNFLFTLK